VTKMVAEWKSWRYLATDRCKHQRAVTQIVHIVLREEVKLMTYMWKWCLISTARINNERRLHFVWIASPTSAMGQQMQLLPLLYGCAAYGIISLGYNKLNYYVDLFSSGSVRIE